MEDIVVFPANILLKSYNVLFYFCDIIQQVTFKRDKYHKYLFYSWSGQNFIVTMWVRDAFIVGFPENKIFFAKRSENDVEFREKTTKFSTNSLKIAKEFREIYDLRNAEKIQNFKLSQSAILILMNTTNVACTQTYFTQ